MIMQPLATGGGGGTQHAAGNLIDVSGTSYKVTTGFKPASLTIACSEVSTQTGNRPFMYSYRNGAVAINYDTGGTPFVSIALNDDGFTITSTSSIEYITGGYTAFK